MRWFLLRLVAGRPHFAFSMTAEEQATIARHSAYWRAHLERGTALIFSPVADPAGPWGLCIAQAADSDAAGALADDDPAVVAGVGNYDVLELSSPVLGRSTETP